MREAATQLRDGERESEKGTRKKKATVTLETIVRERGRGRKNRPCWPVIFVSLFLSTLSRPFLFFPFLAHLSSPLTSHDLFIFCSPSASQHRTDDPRITT